MTQRHFLGNKDKRPKWYQIQFTQDLCGPMKTRAKGSHEYFIIDDCFMDTSVHDLIVDASTSWVQAVPQRSVGSYPKKVCTWLVKAEQVQKKEGIRILLDMVRSLDELQVSLIPFKEYALEIEQNILNLVTSSSDLYYPKRILDQASAQGRFEF